MKLNDKKKYVNCIALFIIMLVLGSGLFAYCYHMNLTSPRMSADEINALDGFPENGPVIITGWKPATADGREMYCLRLHLDGVACIYTPRNLELVINGESPVKETAYVGNLYLLSADNENGGNFEIELSADATELYSFGLGKYIYFGSIGQVTDFINVSLICNYYLRGCCMAVLIACVTMYIIKPEEKYLLWLAMLSFFTASYGRVRNLLSPLSALLGTDILLNDNIYQLVNQIFIGFFQYMVMKHLMPVKIGKFDFFWYVLAAAVPALFLYNCQTFYFIALCFFYAVLFLCYLLCFTKAYDRHAVDDRYILCISWAVTAALRFFDIFCDWGLIPPGDANLRIRLRGILSIVFILAFFIIVTKRFAQKFNEADLLNIHLEEESRRKAREQTVFVRSMLHNLKTPVFSLSGYTDMAIKALETSPETALRYMKKTNEKALLVGQMMDNIFLVTQIQSDMMILQEVPVDLRSVLTAVMDSSTEAAKGKKHIETLGIAESLSVTGDPIYLQQAFQNIVDNARIHTPEGGSICVSVGKVSELAEIKISDTGCGIAPEEAGKIFDAYYSKHADGKRSSGLGLYISSEIIKRHHGTVTVSSEPGHGACFTVQLPLSSEKI